LDDRGFLVVKWCTESGLDGFGLLLSGLLVTHWGSFSHHLVFPFCFTLCVLRFGLVWWRQTYRLVSECKEAKKKLEDKTVEANKKTFLKAQIPKMETEIAALKIKVVGLLEAEELDPRGEWYVMAEKLTK
jgi:hypothetical protein